MDAFSFSPTVYLHIKNRWFQEFKHHALQSCWKHPRTVICVCRTIGDLPKIYNDVFKWVYLWRCGQGWGSEEKEHYNKPPLSCFNKEESPFLPSFQTHAFPMMCSMEVTGCTVRTGDWNQKYGHWGRLNSTWPPRLMDKWWLERGYAYLNYILSLLQSNDITNIAVW